MMTFTAEEYRILAGKEFNAILAADPELKRLNGLRYDRGAEFRLLLEALGFDGGMRIGALPVRTLTAAKWSLLDALGSPLIRGGAVTTADLDLFLYVLCRDDLTKLSCAPHELPGLASGYAAATGLTPEEVQSELAGVINLAFLPLRMLPEGKNDGDEVHFDSEWLTRLCGLAARETHETVRCCMFEMALSAVCWHFVHYVARESDKKVERKVPAEIEALMDARIDELGRDFLDGLNGEVKLFAVESEQKQD